MHDSKPALAELARLIHAWPGLVAGHADALIDDCLVLAGQLGDARRLVDVGSGGGLPGLPLKIVRPELEVSLVEADGRKAAFLVRACAELGLKGVEVVNLRAEEAARSPRYREVFDVAVARALAPMPVLVELCLPFVRVGGRLLAQKTDKEDMARAARAVDLVGGGALRLASAPSEARRSGTIVIVEKVRPTPDEYPRRSGVPARRPL